MAIARTGVFVDDYVEYASTLPAELQRLLSTMRELDERSQLQKVLFLRHPLLETSRVCIHLVLGYLNFYETGCVSAMINQARDQTKFFLGFHSHCLKKANHADDEAALEKARKEIDANQENALSLCTEKVLLARQAYDLIDGHVKRLDEDLKQFAEDLKQEGKIPVDEPATLPPLPITVKDEKRKSGFLTSQSKRPDFREKDWDRERDRDLELMPPPGSHKKNVLTSMDVDQPDPNEPTYCVCHQVSFGDMIACDNENCEGGEWFHYSCVGLTPETRFKGKWFCPTCRELM